MEKRSVQQQNWIHLGQKPLALEMDPVQKKNEVSIILFYIHPLQPTHCQLLLTCTPMTASFQTSHLPSHLGSSHTSKCFSTMYLSTAGLHIKTKNIQGVEFEKASPLGQTTGELRDPWNWHQFISLKKRSLRQSSLKEDALGSVSAVNSSLQWPDKLRTGTEQTQPSLNVRQGVQGLFSFSSWERIMGFGTSHGKKKKARH